MKPLDPRALGEKLRSLREEAGLTQKEVSDFTAGEGVKAVSVPTISEIENGKREPERETLVRLARVFYKKARSDQKALDLLSDGVGRAGAEKEGGFEHRERPSPQELFLRNVEQAASRMLRGATIERRPGPPPFDEYLNAVVSVQEGDSVDIYAIGALDRVPTAAEVDLFHAQVHRACYGNHGPGAVSRLVYDGPPARFDRKEGLKVLSLPEYCQVYVNLEPYEAWLRTVLRNERYAPEMYLPPIATFGPLPGGKYNRRTDDARREVLAWLRDDNQRVLVVVADFGTGKTFLMHELVRSLLGGHRPRPILVFLRDADKAMSVHAMIARQFIDGAGLDAPRTAALGHMIERGLVVLLLDGFDELASRLTHDEAAEHLAKIVQVAAGDGQVKLVLTSRREHFKSDGDLHGILAIRGLQFLELERFSDDQVVEYVRRWAEQHGEGEGWAGERLAALREKEALHKLGTTPRLLYFIVQLPLEKLAGATTKTELFRLVLEQWLDHEQTRKKAQGAHGLLSLAERWAAVHELARKLWLGGRAEIDLGDLSAIAREVLPRLEGLRAQLQAAHEIGSGTLLVRREDRFRFAYESILEWLTADVAAEDLRLGGRSALLVDREMTPLMAEFFAGRADPELAAVWATEAMKPGKAAREAENARLAGRFGVQIRARRIDYRGQDLRNKDFSGVDLSGADLREVDLSGAILAGATLAGADLRGAKLLRANLTRAVLMGADLRGADLSHARLLAADLRGATLDGARLRYAKLVGAQLDTGALARVDSFGASELTPSPVRASADPQASGSNAVVFSSDGALIASGHDDGSVRLSEAATGALLWWRRGHEGKVWSVAFSHDDALLASASADHTVRLWSPRDGSLLRSLKGHQSSVLSVAFSHDDALLASASADRTVRLWSPWDGTLLRSLEGHQSSVLSVAFSHDDALLASASADHTVRLWSPRDGSLLRSLEGHQGNVWSVAFSHDDALLASASVDHTVRLWSPRDGSLLRSLEGHEFSVLSVAFSHDDALLASASGDHTVRLWSPRDGSLLRSLEGHEFSVRSVAFSHDDTLLASASDDKTVRLWSPRDGSLLRSLKSHHSQVLSVAFSHDDALLASASDDKTVRLWSPRHGSLLRSLKGHQASVRTVAFSHDDALLASASDDKTVRLWSPRNGSLLRSLKDHHSDVLSVAFSHDDALLASASVDETVRLWSPRHGSLLRSLKGHQNSVWSVAFSHDDALLASASNDQTVRLWSPRDGSLLRSLKGHQSYVFSVAFSHDDALLASASGDHTVRLWSPRDGSLLRSLEGHQASVWSVAFSHDDALLASASEDATVRLWSPHDGSLLRTLTGHQAAVWSVAFSHDAALLASASGDGTVRIWQVATGRCLAVLIEAPDGWAAYRPEDGRYKSGGDTAGRFWHLSGLCRFEPGELDDILPNLRLRDDEPLLAP